MKSPSYTLLAVHAHPDDESSGTGGLLRLASDAGHQTVLVTCTNGALGEVHGSRKRLDPRNRRDDRQYLARVRYRELDRSARLLRIRHVHRLGYQDSGMAGWETNHEPLAFVNVNPQQVVGRLVRIIRYYRPEIIVTYDETGGYGHPDHVMTHRMTVAALQASADPAQFPTSGPAWQVIKLYYTAWARSEMLRAFKWMHLFGLNTPLRHPDFNPDHFGCPDQLITTKIDVRPVIGIKRRALFAHRSQMGRQLWFRCFLCLTERRIYRYESFRRIYPPASSSITETDIFSGLTSLNCEST